MNDTMLMLIIKVMAAILVGAMAIVSVIFLAIVIAAVISEKMHKDIGGNTKEISACRCLDCYYYKKNEGKCDIFVDHPEWFEDEDKLPKCFCTYNVFE